MDWVMVPVPEELTEQVQALLLGLSYKSALAQWDDDTIGEHMLSLEAEPLGVLCAVAGGVVDGEPIEDVQVAETFKVSVREVYGLVREANDVAGGAARGDLVHARYEVVEDQGGSRGRRVLYMLGGYAAMVRNQETVLASRLPTTSTP